MKEWKRDERDRVFKSNLQVENIRKQVLKVVQVLKRSGSRSGFESSKFRVIQMLKGSGIEK